MRFLKARWARAQLLQHWRETKPRPTIIKKSTNSPLELVDYVASLRSPSVY